MTIINKFDLAIKTFARANKSFAPPPNFTISQWADEFRFLSPESSSEPGKFSTERAPYQREIMDAISSDETETIVLMLSSQVGKTEIINNVVGYFIDYDPAPILVVQPTEAMAKTYSTDRLAPMIRDCPTLLKKVSDGKARSKDNAILHKKFRGGHITLIGANAPSQLASRPIRVVLLDEIDRFPMSAGTEGDPVQLAIKRTATFWNRKIVEVSTPTIKGFSKIEKEYESSSKEVLHIKCPSCGKFQPYNFENLKFEHEKGTNEVHNCMYLCVHCGTLDREVVWKKQPIKWIAENPQMKRKRGFHLNEMASPWKSWEDIAKDFLEAKRQGVEMLKVWTNTSMGLPFEDITNIDMTSDLLSRRINYTAEVPSEVLFITCGVDVQDNRLEYEIVGFAQHNVTFGIKYGVIMGSPASVSVWNTLDEILFKKYKRADGVELQISTTCIDTGGHFTKEVYSYCKKREAHKIWGIKGRGGVGVPFIVRPKKRNEAGCYLFGIGVDSGKDTIYARLKVINFDEGGYCYFPKNPSLGYDEQYFNGLTAEKKEIKSDKGKVRISWVLKKSGLRNEPLDLRNYALAAYDIANPNLDIIKQQISGNYKAPEVQSKRKKGSKGVNIW